MPNLRDLTRAAILQSLAPTPVDMHPQTREITPLSPPEEAAFRQWALVNGIRDVDSPQSFYDYRGYFQNVVAKGLDQTSQAYADGPHFPDTYKQHGHPTFSTESKYSRGANDGGNWVGEVYIPQGMKPQSFRDIIELARRKR